MMLETEVFKFEPDITGISCSGRFTLGNRLSEMEGLVNSLIEDGVRKLVLDLTHVEFVDSAGLGVIMRALWRNRTAAASCGSPAPTNRCSACSTSRTQERS